MTISVSRLCFYPERLERRLHLAGNVSVGSGPAGEIVFLGDAADNNILMETSENGRIWIRGLDNTTINGVNVPLLLSDSDVLDRGLIIRLRGGDDTVSIRDLTITGTTTIDTGGGDDLLVVDNLEMEGEANFLMRGGLDQVFILGVDSLQDVNVSTSSGNDIVSIVGLESDQAVSVTSGSGRDTIVARNVYTRGEFRVASGTGDDTIELVGVGTEADLHISLSSGDDILRLDEGYVNYSSIIIEGAGGNDLVSLTDTFAEETLTIRTGGGSDLVAINRVKAPLQISLGAGADGLLIASNAFRPESNIDSGGGNDLLLLGGRWDDLSVRTAGGRDTVVFNRIDVTESFSIDMGGQRDEVFFSQMIQLPNDAVVNGGAGRDTIQWDSSLAWHVPLQSVETTLPPQPIDNVVLSAIFVFGTEWVDRGGLASDLA